MGLCVVICCVQGQQFVTYVDAIDSWYPPESIAAALGVPTYAATNRYNVVNLSFWLNSGPADAALVWAEALTYCSTDNPWGNTTAAIQKAWLNLYHNAGKKVLVSAFGATEFPTSQGYDPIQTANSLAQFVIDNQLDGVDLDYEDNSAMNSGAGVNWIINCTTTLRALLPAEKGYIITHAPQAPYFMSSYAQGGYLTIDKQAGYAINWYNVQFYNQGSSDYSTYETLIETSDGWAPETAVLQIGNSGVPLSKIVIGKPVTQAGAVNTGYVDVNTLANIITQAVSQTQWSAGVMGWEYNEDLNGTWIATLAACF